MKGLLVDVYRSSFGDFSAGGISSRVQKMILVGDGIPEIFETDPETPAVRLVYRPRFDYLHAEPVDGKSSTANGWMSGGAFIYSHDGRFPSKYPIPLHDRQEEVRS